MPSESTVLAERAEWDELEADERAFAYAYVQNGYKHADAAVTAGRSRSSGIGLLRKPLISAFIAHLQAEQQRNSLITQRFVENLYLELIPKLNGEEAIPIVTAAGAEIQAKKFHSGEMVSVARDLSKVSGLVEEEKAITNQVNIQINLGNMGG